MARTNVTQIAETTAPPQTPPKKRGRPRTRPEPEADDDPTSEEEANEALAGDEARYALDRDKDTPFFDWLRMFSEKDWQEQLGLYLNRTAPIIDRNRTGNYHYIQKFTAPVTEEEIKRANYGGSGGYQLICTRWNPITRRTARLRDHYFMILDKNFPPCIPLGEWIESDKNKEWLWAKPILEDIEAKEATERAAGRTNGSAPAAATIGDDLGRFTQIIGLVEKFMPKTTAGDATALAKQVVSSMREMSAEKGSSTIETLVLPLLLKLIENGNAKASAGPDPMVTLLTNELTAIRQQNADLMKQLKPKSLSEQLADLKAAKEATTMLFPRGPAAAAGTDWPDALAKTAEKLIEQAPAYIQAFAFGKSGIAPRPSQQQRGPAAAPVAQPEQVTENSEMDTIRHLSNQFGPLIDETAPILADQFTRGMTGMHFRNWFLQSYGNKAYSFLRQMSPETIIGITAIRTAEAPAEITRQQLAQLQPRAEYERFIKEFLSDMLTPEETEEASNAASFAAPQPAQEF